MSNTVAPISSLEFAKIGGGILQVRQISAHNMILGFSILISYGINRLTVGFCISFMMAQYSTEKKHFFAVLRETLSSKIQISYKELFDKEK